MLFGDFDIVLDILFLQTTFFIIFYYKNHAIFRSFKHTSVLLLRQKKSHVPKLSYLSYAINFRITLFCLFKHSYTNIKSCVRMTYTYKFWSIKTRPILDCFNFKKFYIMGKEIRCCRANNIFMIIWYWYQSYAVFHTTHFRGKTIICHRW